jgi:uncharacterized protein YjbI with pentapeptide repeats
MRQIDCNAHGGGTPDGLFTPRRVEEGYAMANEEHLARLKQGVKAWNQWRAAFPTLKPELEGADLAWADLSQANLTEANLFQVNLFHANLAEANLARANLSGACLTEANLSEAHIFQANLSWANLLKANLTLVNLRANPATTFVTPVCT